MGLASRRVVLMVAARIALGVLPGLPAFAAESGPPRTVHVVSNGWHAGIVIARGDLPEGALPEAAEFADLDHLEIGWGDREYYPSPSPTIVMALAAGLGANPAVIHLAGRTGPPDGAAAVEVVRLSLGPAGYAALIAGIDATFDRGAGATAERIAPGLVPRAAFFAAHGSFSLANTCNTWVASRLADGGVPVSADGVATAGDLMNRLRAVSGAVSIGTPR